MGLSWGEHKRAASGAMGHKRFLPEQGVGRDRCNATVSVPDAASGTITKGNYFKGNMFIRKGAMAHHDMPWMHMLYRQSMGR